MSDGPKPAPVRVRPKGTERAAAIIKSLPRGRPTTMAPPPQDSASGGSILDKLKDDPLIFGIGAAVAVAVAIGIYSWMSKRDVKRAVAIDGEERFMTRLRMVEEKLREQQARHHAENFPKIAQSPGESLAEAAPVEPPPVQGRFETGPGAQKQVPHETGALREAFPPANQMHTARIPAYRITPIDPFTMA